MTRIALLGASIMWLASTTTFAADVAVSVQVGQPGFYGRIDIGRFPQPQVIYPQPIVILHPPTVVVQQPIYLRVPPGHQKNWRKHCRRYQACGQPVFFVQDQWYQTNVLTRSDQKRESTEERGQGKGNENNKGHGKGNGNGKGHGRNQNEQ